MRRIAFSLSIVFAGISTGCQNAQPTAEPLQSANADYPSLQPDLYVTGGQTQEYQPAAPYRTYQDPAQVDAGYNQYAAYDETPEELSLAASSKLTHSVSSGDTLFGLARSYYGDESRWKDIYEANRPVLKSPDLLLVGQELKIP